MLFGQRFALRWCPVATQVKPGPALATDAEARLAVLKKEIAEATAAMEAAKELDRFEEAGALQHKVRAPLQLTPDKQRFDGRSMPRCHAKRHRNQILPG